MSITAPLIPCDVLYVPAGGWNIPQWQAPVTTLSILFGKHMSITAPLIPCDVLYVPAGGWNIPQWQAPVTTL
ncbi:hypothetical protein V5H41_29295, partial [Salmonella enterica]